MMPALHKVPLAPQLAPPVPRAVPGGQALPAQRPQPQAGRGLRQLEASAKGPWQLQAPQGPLLCSESGCARMPQHPAVLVAPTLTLNLPA
jgi:hypothetical protein